MRPLRLEITAFGPFAGKEVIDFEEIAGASLLLIHGPTGSGKTTILDAICFALFGDSSGAAREGREMRCDGAPPTLATSVRYEFALGAKTYCALRSPEQERPSKRGGGMTTDAHQATLWDRSAAADGSGEGKVLASGAAKVKKAVSEIFGFDSDQFRQVVMLPQGQFRRLLSAESKEKEKILQRLFQTSHYAKLERALADRASKLRRGFEDDQVAMETLLGQGEVETIEDLALRIAGAAERHQLTQDKVPKKKSSSEAALAALAEGKSDNQKLAERKAALATVEELKSKEKEITSLRAQWSGANSALPLIPRADALRDRNAEADAAEAKLASASDAVALSEKAMASSLEALKKEEARGKEREQAAVEKAELEAIGDSVTRLEELRAKCAALSAEIQKQDGNNEESNAALSSAKATLEAARKRLGEDEKSAAQVEVLKIRLQQNTKLKKGREELEILRSKILQEEVAHQAAQVALDEKKSRAQDCDEACIDLEERWQRGQAGALARALAPGDACPVCGSEDHPKLAKAAESLPSEDTIEQARKSLRDAREALAEAQETESLGRSQLSSSKALQESVSNDLADAASRDLVEWEAELTAQGIELDAALSAKDRAAGSASELAAAEVNVASATTLAEEIASTLAKKKIEAATARGSLEELESKVPPHLRPTGSLVLAKATLEKRSQSLAKALESAQTAAGTAKQEFAAAGASCRGAKEAVIAARAKASEAAHELEVHCGKAGFENLEEFAAAKEAVSKISEWGGRLKEHEGEVQASKDRLKRAEEAAEGKTLADIEALEELEETAKASLVTAIRAEAEAKHLRCQLVKTQTDYESIRKRVAVQEEQWKVVASVSNLANGKVPPKVSFQRFVLAALLDEVLLAASARLARMSKGRFSLQRQTESRHKAKASGLDLEVMDAYTGKARAVTTLSGGESFLAALALSLGLADVVQGFTGGIRLDTLLIDEGFGTLDSDALDLALDTLTELKAEGRLVAIISHVEELKLRIPTRLEVSPGEQGSSTQFFGE